MNERIRELSAKSLVKSEGEWVFSQEKFAELIVRECVEICENKTDHLNPKMYEVWRGALACSSDIKQHFGVGE